MYLEENYLNLANKIFCLMDFAILDFLQNRHQTISSLFL